MFRKIAVLGTDLGTAKTRMFPSFSLLSTTNVPMFHKKKDTRKGHPFAYKFKSWREVLAKSSVARLSWLGLELDPWLCVPGFLPVCLFRNLRDRFIMPTVAIPLHFQF